MNPVQRSIAAIFAEGGVAIGAEYVVLVCLLPRPMD